MSRQIIFHQTPVPMQLRFRLTHYGTMQGDAWDWQVTGSHCSLLTDLPLDRVVSPVLLTEGQPVLELQELLSGLMWRDFDGLSS
ncbi:hypothetical protein NQZ68_031406 [Dissostichus eleginoides]|nr:hypothetical protein NQZ68_031406 [Dissostichus eleginoides]